MTETAANPDELPKDDPNDVYTKRTRPMVARQSWYMTMAYGAVCIASSITPGLSQITFQWEIFLAMSTPALFYMGLREVGKWKNGL